ncbi:MAG: NUDIX domain-containing protein [Hyphomonadaceae bacterium]|nr:NUDIX domain-containing protein [Clostridia bacterium]
MSDYIQYIREMVGHEPLILCACGALLFNAQDEVLLMLRTDNGCWGLPGGYMEMGETPEACIMREVYEEVGVTFTNPTLLGAYAGEHSHYTYPNGDECYITVLCYTGQFSGTPKCDGKEGERAVFFPIEQLPHPINPPDQQVLRDYLRTKWALPKPAPF